jgi:uncharacterized membrane protein YvbJ
MKTGAVCVLAVALFMGETALFAAEPASPDECVVQFFEASKNGDTARMKQLMTGSFYQQRKVLLEENTTYPDFLRKHYDGAHLQITNMREEPRGWVVEVRIKYADGNVDSNKFLVQKDASGTWKIIQDIHP